MSETKHWQTLDADRGVWCREYVFDGKDGRANTFVVRLRAGELLAISPATGMSADAFDELEQHGKVVALVAPNGFHHLGQNSWQRRYPDAKAYAPPAAAKRIGKKNPGLEPFGTFDELQKTLPEDVWVGQPDGKVGDTVARVRTGTGSIWYFNDLVMNMSKAPGNFLIRALFKWTDSGPGFKVARLIVKFLVKDKASFKAWLLKELEAHPPVAVLTGHGPAITDRATAAKLPEMVQSAV